MDKKRELLAKTLMDLSKILFVSVFANYLLSSNQSDQMDYTRLLFIVSFVMIVGGMGWMAHPGVVAKGED